MRVACVLRFVRDTFNTSDVYDFLAEYSQSQYASMSLGDAWDRMDKKKDLYLGFSYALMRNNPAWRQAIFDAISHHGEEFKKVTNLENQFNHGKHTYFQKSLDSQMFVGNSCKMDNPE